MGKIKQQELDTSVTTKLSNSDSHIANTSNPHGVTASQVGAEPANANIQNHIASTSNPHATTYSQVGAAASGHNHNGTYEPVITAGTTGQFWRGDKSWQAINLSSYAPLASPTFTGTVSGVTASMVGLGNVTNESKATMFTNTTLTGAPTAPTPAIGNRSTQIATMGVFTNEFANSGTNSGYQKLPSGVIIQWGNVTATSMTFPIAFTSTPMVIHSATTSGYAYWQSGGMEGVQSLSTTGFVVWLASGSYIAIGR